MRSRKLFFLDKEDKILWYNIYFDLNSQFPRPFGYHYHCPLPNVHAPLYDQ